MLRNDCNSGRTIRNGLMRTVAVVGVAAALGGCSAEILRFDAPAFNLNGDKSALAKRTVDGSGNDLQYDQPHRPAPVATVRRSSEPAANYRPRQSDQKIARAPVVTAPINSAPTLPEPISGTADTKGERGSDYAPLTTGALSANAGSVTVQAGDTLYRLSRRYGVSVTALQRANGLTGNVIRPGQKLVLPGPARDTTPIRPTTPRYNTRSVRPTQHSDSSNSYIVRPGDSLYGISRRTGVSVAVLKRMNGITNVRSLKPGVRLTLGQDVSDPSNTRVAARTDRRQDAVIQSKSIRTLPIERDKASSAAPSPYRPTILNQRPNQPIVTKPEQKTPYVPKAPAEVHKFRWPAQGRVIARFNHSGQGVKNDGINIALPMGTDVAAAEGGVVAYAGSELKGYGNLILLRHDNGWVSAYAHVSELLVKRGDRIRRGEIIAKAGRSGDVTQPQLHFELRKGAKPVDPIPHLASL